MAKSTQVRDYTQGFLRERIVECRNDWESTKEIMDRLGIWSSRTVCKRKNSDSLESKNSAPLNPDRKYEWNDLYLLYALKKHLKLSGDDCIETLEEDYNIVIKRSSAYYYLKNRWLTKKEKTKPWVFKEYDPWYIHIDISYWPKLWTKKAYIYVAIDRATRIIYIEVHEDKKADTAAAFLRKAIDFFPFEIEKILTDNGKEFTLKNHLWKYDLEWAFDKVCDEFNIEHRTTKPFTPQTNGMVEKANDIIKSGTVKRFLYENYEDIKKDLWQYMVYYNLHRRHGSLRKEWKGKTPYDALVYYRNSDIEIKWKMSPKERREKLLKLAKEKGRNEYPKWK